MARYGLIGEKLSHSYSKTIHELLGKYEYQLMPLAPSELDEFMRRADFCGINVTIPYKKAVIPYCSELSETAKRIGSVNTIVRRADGTLFGDNTDCFGFCFLAKSAKVDFANKKALVFGSGGTSLTVCAAVRDAGGEPVVISRSNGGYETLSRHSDAEIAVNTTPLGMFPNAGNAAADLSVLPQLHDVLDVVYNPLRTKLVYDAQKRGINAAGGLSMLAAQAVRSAELFCAEGFSERTITDILQKLRPTLENIVLVGMPGCGKSTVARALAERLGRGFADTDEWIEQKAGMSCESFIERNGEDAFRALESEAARKLGAANGLVIATGGGILTRKENAYFLAQNARTVFLRRDISLLERSGRPLSRGEGALEKLYAQRLPLFLDFCDVIIDNNVSVSETVQAVAEVLG